MIEHMHQILDYLFQQEIFSMGTATYLERNDADARFKLFIVGISDCSLK